MRIVIIFLLSCAAVLGAEPELHIFTSVRTNATGSISTKDVFTRNGQTNLVCNTTSKAGAVQVRVHRFYHHGALVGLWTAMPESSGFVTEAGCPFALSFGFDALRNPKSAVIGAKDGVVLDAFSYTNGVFVPVASALLAKANTVGSELRGGVGESRGQSKKK
jgi:hypothetical protein